MAATSFITLMAIFRILRRKWMLRKPLPESRRKILEQDVPHYSLLPGDLRETLHQRMTIFLDEKHIEGCAGLKMTEKIEVVIAAYASLLILGETSGGTFCCCHRIVLDQTTSPS